MIALRILAVLGALLAAGPALSQDRPLSPGTLKSDGTISFGSGLPSLGKRQAGKTILTPDALQIGGPGSTGDVGEMSLRVPGSGAVARSLMARFDENVQLSDFGWDKSGNTDCGPALRAAITKLGTRGGTISQAAGVCWINSPVPWTTAIRFQGQGWREGAAIGEGSWIKITDPSFTPFAVSGQPSRGSEFRDIAVWQQQPGLTGATWAPVEYPPVWDIQNTLGTVKFSNVFLLSVTRGINSFNAGRLDVDGLYGQVYRYGVSIDQAQDLPRIGRVHFWTYASDDPRILTWQIANSDAIVSARNDNPFFRDIFAIAMRSALHFTSSANGITNKFQAVNIDGDLTQAGILIDGNGTTGQVTNLVHQGNSPIGGSQPGSTALKIAANNVSVQVNNLDSRLADVGAVAITGTGNRVQVSNGYVAQWDRSGAGKNAFDVADGGSAANANVIQASNIEFAGGGTNIVPASGVGLVVKLSDFYSRSDVPTFSPRLTATGSGGSVNLEANGRTVLSVDNPSGDSTILMRSDIGNMSLNVQSSSVNADLDLKPQGADGSARLWAAGGPAVRTAATSDNDTGLVARRANGTVHLLAEGNANASIDLIPSGAGAVTVNGALRLNIANTTGSASATLGANSPATAPSAPYSWITAKTSDGTTVYIPAWK
ncbi:hypothetical protein MMB17_07560 [Methylobacterium organophilum]|uniref:hypothetical protein n=1 Tax=Methylobacterium organophilum TaxID=410 RepID=UPI001F1323F8|nr:hypothetical protein [Methylobacterium organophilum]UMY19147.1 hypothetical protein MMB17_07560 [Methylobacterium organophilum]